MRILQKKIAIVLTSMLSFSFLYVTQANAFTGTIPVPVIGTALGFEAGKGYTAIAGTGPATLEPGETFKSLEIFSYLLNAGVPVGAPCTTGTLLGSKSSVGAVGTPIPVAATLTWTNPADSAGKMVCVFIKLTTERTPAAPVSVTGPAAYATISGATASATPTATAVAEAPSFTKPSFSTSPKVGVKAKIKINKVSMNGNEFKSRSVTLYVCDKSDCSDKSDSNATKYSDLKDTDAKTITMPEAKGKKGQYVVVYDRVVYGADKTVEKASSIKQLTTSTASASPSATEESVEATPEVTVEETVEAAPVPSPTEIAAAPAALSTGLILGIVGVIVIALLLVIIVILARKKK